MSNESILVTGGAGFIGSCFVRQWIREESSQIVVLDKLTYAGNLDSLAPVENDDRFIFRRGDIGDAQTVDSLLREFQPREIVNFAAESHVDRSIDDPADFVMTNVVGTFQLLESSRRYWEKLPSEQRGQFRFLHVSTDEVYGTLGTDGKFTESTRYAPNSPYSASKASSDHFVRSYHHTYGMPTLITNCSNNYGPYQFPEKLVPLMILNALEGKPLPVYGDGLNVRDWLFVEDHCQAIRQVLRDGEPGEVYNIGGDCERTNLEVVQAICDTVDRLNPGLAHAPCSSLITFVKDRPGHDRRYAIDASKMRQQLGWTPKQDFESGITLTIEWYMNNEQWISRASDGSYQRERLGLTSAKEA